MGHWSEHKTLIRSVAGICWALLFVVAWQSASLTWQVVDRPVLLLPAAKESATGNTRQAVQQDIAAWDLFGRYDESNAQINVEAAPETRLRLVLLGVFTSADMKTSSAIIAETGREGEFFRVGDRVQGRTTLASVYEDKVVLDTNGKLETLKFEDAGAPQAFTENTPQTATRSNNNGRARSGNFNERLQDVRSPEDFVEFAKDQLEGDTEQALNNIGLRAAGDGYEVTENASMLSGMGMKPGDKIISVNGHSLGNPDADKNLIDEVYESGAARIEVERGGSRFTINHSFR